MPVITCDRFAGKLKIRDLRENAQRIRHPLGILGEVKHGYLSAKFRHPEYIDEDLARN
jgi:hypothetical protein